VSEIYANDMTVGGWMSKSSDLHAPVADTLSKDDFLLLLVEQLRHQDPTSPMENMEFISQSAQFSSLEQMTNLNKNVESLLTSQVVAQTSNLIGKTVLVEGVNDVGETESFTGTVDAIKIEDGKGKLVMGDKLVDLDDVKYIYNQAPQTEAEV